MFVTYPDVCWCQLISPSITGLRHYRSGCALLLGARSSHERRDEAHDPRQSWSDTSPPISQAVPGLQSGSDDTHFVLPSSRQPKPGTKLSRLNLSAPKTGKLSLHAQNSPNSTLLDEQGELCHRHNPRFLDRARSVRPQAVRSHVNPLAHTSTGYSIDGRAPHTGPARPGCGARGRWRGLAGLRDRSLRAFRLACRDLAGGPPPTGTQSSPAAARAHNEAATGFPATASSMNERQREISATSTRAVTAATHTIAILRPTARISSRSISYSTSNDGGFRLASISNFTRSPPRTPTGSGLDLAFP